MSQPQLTPSCIGFLVYMLIISLTGGILNASIIIVYMRTFRHVASLYFITILAFINFITAFLVIPFVIYTELYPSGLHSSIICGLSYFLRHFLALLSIFVLLFIAYERLNVMRARTVKRLKIVEKSLIYNSRKLMLAAFIFCLLYSAFCFYLYEKNQDNDVNTVNCKPEPYNFGQIYERLTICIGIIVYVCMIYFYICAYLIVYKSVMKSNRVGSKRNEQGETSQTEDNETKQQQNKKTKHDHCVNEDYSQKYFSIQDNQKMARVFIVSGSFQVAHSLNNVNNNFCVRPNVSTTIQSCSTFKRKDWHVAKIFILVIDFFFKLLSIFSLL